MTKVGTQSISAILENIRHSLERASDILVVSHIDPDGDAIGSQLAFGQYLIDLGKTVVLARDSEIPHKYRFLPAIDRIVKTETLPETASFDTILVLECPEIERTGSASRFLKRANDIINIDHHQGNSQYGDKNWIETEASSVGEMTYEYFEHVGYDFSVDVATQLYTAILTDTGRFRYSCTSTRTMRIAGELIRRGADPKSICENVYFKQQPSTVKLLGMVLNTIEYHAHGTICTLTLTRDMLKRVGAQSSESDGLVDYSLYTTGVKVGILFKENDDNSTKLSLRSQTDFDVAAIARSFGGGGHTKAAGCKMSVPLDEAKRIILDRLSKAL